MTDVKLIVLIDHDKKQSIENIANDLSKIGMQIDRKMSITGVISGTAAIENLDALRRAPGVAELREEEIFSTSKSE